MRSMRFAPHLRRYLSLSIALALVACSSVAPRNQAPTPPPRASVGQSLPVLPAAGSGRGGYYKDDGPGDQPPEGLMEVADADPKIEPYSKAASQPYVVFGKTYVPIIDERPFTQRGFGTWYGKKFHGQKTSSGELYDMYKMTAAHPTLPIPSYARVTNLKTGVQVIVRINDRGPFHSTRIIDLSYTAALKLGYLSSGSSELEVQRLLPEEITRLAATQRGRIAPTTITGTEPVTVGSVTPASVVGVNAGVANTAAGSVVIDTAVNSGFYLQLGAYVQQANANTARDKLMQSLDGIVEKMSAIAADGLYRLLAGPYASRLAAQEAAQRISQHSHITPFIIER